jgi:hypothetical protein
LSNWVTATVLEMCMLGSAVIAVGVAILAPVLGAKGDGLCMWQIAALALPCVLAAAGSAQYALLTDYSKNRLNRHPTFKHLQYLKYPLFMLFALLAAIPNSAAF